MLQGLGYKQVGYGIFTNGTDTPITQQILNAQYLNMATVKYEPEFQMSTGFNGGRIQTLDVVVKKEKFSISMGWDSFDKNSMELLLGRFFASTSTYSVRKVKTAQVTSGVIVDTALGSTVIADVQVTLLRNDTRDEGYLTVATGTGTPTAATTVNLDEAADTLHFHASLEGRNVSYSVLTDLSTVQTIGVSKSAKRLESLNFVSLIAGPHFPDGMLMVVKNMAKNSGWELNYSDQTKAEITFEVLLDPSADYPIQFIEPPTGFAN